MRTLYTNATVYTGNGFESSFVVEDCRFAQVGKSNLVPGTDYDRCVDLKGQFVCAGFNDSHMHLLSFANALQTARLNEHTSSLKELIRYGREFLQKNPKRPGEWLLGRGFHQDYFEDGCRIPEKEDLDQISTEVPVLFTRACGHCCVANSKALLLANLSKDTEEVAGGRIGRNADGELNGQFFDNAMELIQSAIPLPAKEEIKKMIVSACKELNRYGITSSQTDDYCVYRMIPYEVINEAYRELKEEGRLSVRVYEQCNFSEIEEFQRFLDQGNRTGDGDDFFRIGPLKMLGDGSLGSRTAFLSVPYDDEPSTRGFALYSDEKMNRMVEMAIQNRMQVAVHAIGDACLDQVLNAIEKAQKLYGGEERRHGIVHCQISRYDQLDRIAKMHLHVYVQSIFLDYDNHIVETRVGRELAKSSYRWKTLMKHGMHVSNGSDAPVEIPDVMKGIQCAVTRCSLDGCGPYLKEEAFSVEEALRSFTCEGAYASFEEHEKGRIEAGYLADFVILSANPFETDPLKIHTIEVLRTFLNGKEVYFREE